MKWVNEILHRVTAKSRVERLQLHEWSEDSFNQMIIQYVKQEPTIATMVGWSIRDAYETVCGDGN
ncbi:hypothetical protein ACMZOO_12800 [Catenovulum sp. SX2]|uniref:hypothetical protein n=1 Tax=Catenovulum sp. SX2 TaxID=3398614 RepID=UPI003F84130B